MPFIGRLCGQFSGLLRSKQVLPSPYQLNEHQAWNIYFRLYSRKANIVKRAKKAEERALKKQEKRVFKTARIVKPFPTDECASKEPSTDNVWFQHLHPLNQLSFEEAISYHRESVHETIYNEPDALVNVIAVLNLKTKKQNVTLEKLKGSYMPVHVYPSGNDLRILALCLEKEDIEEALEAGAATVGGLEILKKIEEGQILVEEYDSVVAHTDMMTHLSQIRGLMKTRMPRAALGTLGRDMANMITKVKESRSYNLVCDSDNNLIGWVNDSIGKLNMSDVQLMENFNVYLEGILKQQPRIADLPFIHELYVRSPSTKEVFLLNRSSVLKEELIEVPGNKKELIQKLLSSDKEPVEPVEAVEMN